MRATQVKVVKEMEEAEMATAEEKAAETVMAAREVVAATEEERVEGATAAAEKAVAPFLVIAVV